MRAYAALKMCSHTSDWASLETPYVYEKAVSVFYFQLEKQLTVSSVSWLYECNDPITSLAHIPRSVCARIHPIRHVWPSRMCMERFFSVLFPTESSPARSTMGTYVYMHVIIESLRHVPFSQGQVVQVHISLRTCMNATCAIKACSCFFFGLKLHPRFC